MTKIPAITRRATAFETPWFAVQEAYIEGQTLPYYSLTMNDYVCVVCITAKERIVLVRQFRPAVNCVTLELPAGHVENGETPDLAARRELFEETGYDAVRLESLGTMIPDSGRLANRQWCYYAQDAVATGAERESGVEVIVMDRNEFAHAVETGEFQHALHLAAVMKAAITGRLPVLPPARTS